MKKKNSAAGFLLFLCLTLGACKSAGPHWDENTLVLAKVVSDPVIGQETLDDFRKTHPEITLEVRDYSDEGGKDRLLTEMAAGYIPDLLCVTGLPFRQMAQRGYLEDLWPYIENDPDIGRENVMEPPLRAAEADGKLFTVFRTVTVNTMVGPKRLVGDRTGWTAEELLEAFSRMPEGSTITDYYADKELMFEAIFRMNLDSYVDWERAAVSFDNESFRNALEFVNSFPGEYQWTASESEIAELRYRRLNGLEMLSMAGIIDLSWISYYEDELYGEEIAFVGYPVGDGGVGSGFAASPMISMSATCRQKEAAWDLLRTLLLPRYHFRSMLNALQEGATVGFPVNRPDYEVMKRVFTSENGYRPGGKKRPPVTEEQAARFEELYHRMDKLDFCDKEIYDLVWESCAPYFAGDKTLDETVEMIQNRVSLYVNESR